MEDKYTHHVVLTGTLTLTGNTPEEAVAKLTTITINQHSKKMRALLTCEGEIFQIHNVHIKSL